MDNIPERNLISVLDGHSIKPPPVWLMRQAGRYLPEYRKLRKRTGGFLDMCYTPELAIEVTLQPIRRFGFDAAILFSDILVMPDALGQKVRFEEGRGPILGDFEPDRFVEVPSNQVHEHLRPILNAVAGVREALPAETALLGFCGAPWTVATYMVAGQGTPDQAPARMYARSMPGKFQEVIDRLADLSAEYLVAQLKAGADAVQIFDSWAGVLDELQFARWCIEPVRKIVTAVRAKVPGARIIGFPKGAGMLLEDYRVRTGVTAIGLDWTVPMGLAQRLQEQGPVQGMLDPVSLVAGGGALDKDVDRILAGLGEGPLVFNLGHGITPDTPIRHVEQMLARIRRGGKG